MTRRVGIELSPSRCTIVDIDLPRRRRGAVARIRRFDSIPWNSDDPSDLVLTLRQMIQAKSIGDRAFVALWGVRSACQFMTLPPAADSDLNTIALREARKSAPLFAEPDVSALVSIAPQTAAADMAKREVSAVATSSPDVRARLAPLVAAGFTIDRVVTPPLALIALSKALHGRSDRGYAYLVVGTKASCVAIVRNGLLVFAREMPLVMPGGKTGPGTTNFADRLQFADRLGAELKRSFLFFKQQSKIEVEQLFVSGDIEDLRSLTAPLIHTLDIEVETLDSPEGLPLAVLDPAMDLRDRAGAMRVAWAAACANHGDERVNILPEEIIRKREFAGLYRSIGAAIAASALVVCGVYALERASALAAERAVASLKDQVQRLESNARQMEQVRKDAARAAARAAALQAAREQGPRLAKVLEAIGNSAPPAVLIHSVELSTKGATWRLKVQGEGFGSPVNSQAAFNAFLRGIASSPYVSVLTAPAVKLAALDVPTTRQGTANSDVTPIPLPPLPLEYQPRYRRSDLDPDLEERLKVPLTIGPDDRTYIPTRIVVEREMEWRRRVRAAEQAKARANKPSLAAPVRPAGILNFTVDLEVKR